MKRHAHRIFWSILMLTFVAGTTVSLLSGGEAGSSPPDENQAASEKSEKTELKDKAEQAAEPKAREPIARDSTECLSDPLVLEDLQKRKEELVFRQKALSAKEAELKAREVAIEEQLKKLESIREDIAKIEEGNIKKNEEKVARLVETFETMSPKPAAQLLSGVEESLAVSAMARMSTAKLAKVMAAMDPSKASRLSELLAGVARAKALSASNGVAAATQQVSQNGMKGGERNDANIERNVSSSAPGVGAGANSIPGGVASQRAPATAKK